MNGLSETIHYGVPIICFPLFGDQRLNAYRVCEELNFGINHNFNTFTPVELKKSIYELLTNKEYSNNILEFTKLQRKYNGIQNSVDLVVNYLESEN